MSLRGHLTFIMKEIQYSEWNRLKPFAEKLLDKIDSSWKNTSYVNQINLVGTVVFWLNNNTVVNEQVG